jgi:hypothetical protein
MLASVVNEYRPTRINKKHYQVEGRFPVFAARGQDAGLLTACTEL